MQTAIVFANPHAGRGERLPMANDLAKQLADRGVEAVSVTQMEALAEAISECRSRSELLAVVAVGGDGTNSAAINRMPADVPLVVFPAGTENLLAKHLGIFPTVGAIADTVQKGTSVKIDCGRANGELFLLMASAGFDADVVHRLAKGRHGNISHWSYLKPILSSIRRYEYPEITQLAWDAAGNALSDLPHWRPRWFFAFNLPCYARGLPLALTAQAMDGLFDMCTFRFGGLWQGLRYLTHVLLERHTALADAHCFQAARIRLEADCPVPYQLDGEASGWLPLEIEVVPKRVTLRVPADRVERLTQPGGRGAAHIL